jgi:hypothetical protein
MAQNESVGFTKENLNSLEAAIAEGAMRVKYSDKEIEYRSLKEMLKIRDLMKRELGLCKSKGKKGLFGGTRIHSEYDKDLC